MQYGSQDTLLAYTDYLYFVGDYFFELSSFSFCTLAGGICYVSGIYYLLFVLLMDDWELIYSILRTTM